MKARDYIKEINYQKLAVDMQRAIDSWNISKYANYKGSLHPLTPAKVTYTANNVQVDFGGFEVFLVNIDLMNLYIEYAKSDDYYCHTCSETVNTCAQRIVSDFYFNNDEAINEIRHSHKHIF